MESYTTDKKNENGKKVVGISVWFLPEEKAKIVERAKMVERSASNYCARLIRDGMKTEEVSQTH